MNNISHHQALTRARFAAICKDSSLVLIACLPLLVPFSASKNIDMQGLILIVAGGFAWCALILAYQIPWKQRAPLLMVLLIIFALSCIVSSAVNSNKIYDLLGAPYLRLGAVGLVACIGCGLIAKTISTKRLILGLYGIICTLGFVAIPYTWLRLHTLFRIGSVFNQADIFAVFLGCGLLLGAYLLYLYPKFKIYLSASQLLLLSLLLISGTRAVLFLIIIFYPLLQNQIPQRWSVKKWLIYCSAVVLMVVAAKAASSERLTSIAYVTESINYRLTLQKYALQASAQKPFLGYGPGNLADALDCSKLHANSLQKTCRKGLFFNSSHNIFIDRLLAIGWVGGISYVLIVVFALFRGLRSKGDTRVLAYCALLIACYYLTNVTSVSLELMFWILLLHILSPLVSGKKAKNLQATIVPPL